MKLLKPDHDTLHTVPGVTGTVRKPVNLGQSETGFSRLRSLRLYRFAAGSVIDGHAEEDEVFVIVSAGSVKMEIGFSDDAVNEFGTFTLSAPYEQSSAPFVAYLPPHSVYRMTPHTDANVSYARATTAEVRQPAVLSAEPVRSGATISVLLDERVHAQRLRLKVLHIDAQSEAVLLPLGDENRTGEENLVHVQGQPADRVASITNGTESSILESWDTAALAADERATLDVPRGANIAVIVVSAV